MKMTAAYRHCQDTAFFIISRSPSILIIHTTYAYPFYHSLCSLYMLPLGSFS